MVRHLMSFCNMEKNFFIAPINTPFGRWQPLLGLFHFDFQFSFHFNFQFGFHFDWSFVSYKRPILGDEAKPKKSACFHRLPFSITEA